MIPVTLPTTRTRGTQQIPHTNSARLHIGQPAAIPATRTATLRTSDRPQVHTAGLSKAQTRALPIASTSVAPQGFSPDPSRSQSAGTASSVQTSASKGSNEQPSDSVNDGSIDPPSKVHIRLPRTRNPNSKRETHHQSSRASETRNRPASGEGQGQLPDTNLNWIEARVASTIAPTVEPVASLLPTPWAPRPWRSPSRTTLTAVGPLTRPTFNPPRRLDPLAAVGYTGLVERLANPYGSGSRSITVGMETEFYLAPLKRENNHTTLEGFVAILTAKHNKQVPIQHPRMKEDVRRYYYSGPYEEWCLVREESLGSNWLPWGIEMVSPIFRAFPGATWRQDVEATWRYLCGNYDIVGTHKAGTHVHVGLEPDYTLTDLKRVAQAVIHFEPAFEYLVPRCRRINPYAKSNWLDSPGLARKGKSRPESIAALGAVNHPQELLSLLHPMELNGYCKDRSFSWNFFSYYEKRTIEFRKPPMSMTSKEALSWAEVALSFVQASTRCKNDQVLQDIPPTVGGLRWFLQQYANETGVNEPWRMDRLWQGTEAEAMLEPKPQVSGLPQQERLDLEAKLRTMALADRRRAEGLIKTAKGRYWQKKV